MRPTKTPDLATSGARGRPASGIHPRKSRKGNPRFDGAGLSDDLPARFVAGKPSRKPEPLLSIPECAQILRTSTKTVYRRIADGQLRAAKVGRLWRIDPADLQDYIRDHKTS